MTETMQQKALKILRMVETMIERDSLVFVEGKQDIETYPVLDETGFSRIDKPTGRYAVTLRLEFVKRGKTK